MQRCLGNFTRLPLRTAIGLTGKKSLDVNHRLLSVYHARLTSSTLMSSQTSVSERSLRKPLHTTTIPPVPSKRGFTASTSTSHSDASHPSQPHNPNELAVDYDDELGLTSVSTRSGFVPFRMIGLPPAGADGKAPSVSKPVSRIGFGGNIRSGTEPSILQQTLADYVENGGRTIDLVTGYEVDIFEELVHQSLYNGLDPDNITTILPISFAEVMEGQAANALPAHVVAGVTAASAAPRVGPVTHTPSESSSSATPSRPSPNTSSPASSDAAPASDGGASDAAAGAGVNSGRPGSMAPPTPPNAPLDFSLLAPAEPNTMLNNNKTSFGAGKGSDSAASTSTSSSSSSSPPTADAGTSRRVVTVSAPNVPMVEGRGNIPRVPPVATATGATMQERIQHKIDEVTKHLEGECVDILMLREFEPLATEAPGTQESILYTLLLELERAVARGRARMYGLHSDFFAPPVGIAEAAASNDPRARAMAAAMKPRSLADLYALSAKAAREAGTATAANGGSNFKAVGFGFNIFETGFVTARTCSTTDAVTGRKVEMSAYEFAKAKGMLTFADRTFDANAGPGAESRLESSEPVSVDYVKALEEALRASSSIAMDLEKKYPDLAHRSGLKSPPPPMVLSWGHILTSNLDRFYNVLRWEAAEQRGLWPSLFEAYAQLQRHPETAKWASDHRSAVMSMCASFGQFVRLSTIPLNNEVNEFLAAKCPKLLALPSLEAKLLAVSLAFEFDSVQLSQKEALNAVADKYAQQQQQQQENDAERKDGASSTSSSASFIPTREEALALLDAVNKELRPAHLQRMKELSTGILDLSKTKVVRSEIDLYASPTSSATTTSSSSSVS